MKLLVAVFSREQNLSYLKVSLDYIIKALEKCWSIDQHFHSEVFLIDFGKYESEKLYDIDAVDRYAHKPEAGFCKNMNAALTYAFFMGFDFLASINDDAFISENFLFNGLSALADDPELAIAAGIPNGGGYNFFHESARWNMPIEEFKMPKETDLSYSIDPIERLWWEASACVYRIRAAEQIVKWDEEFDHYSGIVGDNDYFYRLQKDGWGLVRFGNMRFFHCRGVTQNDFRQPGRGPDPLLKKAWDYFYRKHPEVKGK